MTRLAEFGTGAWQTVFCSLHADRADVIVAIVTQFAEGEAYTPIAVMKSWALFLLTTIGAHITFRAGDTLCLAFLRLHLTIRAFKRSSCSLRTEMVLWTRTTYVRIGRHRCIGLFFAIESFVTVLGSSLATLTELS